MVLSSIRYKLSAVIVWEKEILPTGQMLAFQSKWDWSQILKAEQDLEQVRQQKRIQGGRA